MQRVRHAKRGRLLLRTPGPVPLWDLHVFLCRDQSLPNLSCLRTFEFLTSLGTSLLPSSQSHNGQKGIAHDGWLVGCGLTSHSAIFQLYGDGTVVQFPNFDLLPGTHAIGS